MRVLVNGQDLDTFGDLESFEDSISDIETVTIGNYTFKPYCLHRELWDFYNSWNTYEEYEQEVLWHYAEASGLSILEVDSMAEDAFDNFFGIYSTNAEAGEQLIKLAIKDYYCSIEYLFDDEILNLIAVNNLIEDEDYYFYI